MTKLTTEVLKEIIGSYPEDSDEIECVMARQLLAYEQAAEHPAARITWDGSEFSVSNVSEDFLYGGTAVYLAPVLPKQPEHHATKLDLATIKLWNWNAKITLGETEENCEEWVAARAILSLSDDLLALLAQPVITDNDDDDLIQRLSGRAKFLRDKGEIKTPELIEAAISALSAQLVSEPYKLDGLNIRAVAALREAVRKQWLKSDNFGDKVYWKNMHSIANEIVEAMLAAAPAHTLSEHSAAIKDVIAERARQVSEEGWTPAHDDKYADCELTQAAICYIDTSFAETNWPWAAEWWKPTNPRRDLVKAGALILAEIERMDRTAPAQESE